MQRIKRFFEPFVTAQAVQQFVTTLVWLFAVMALGRCVLALELFLQANMYGALALALGTGLLYDAVLMSKIALVSVVPFFVLYRYFPRFVKISSIVFVVLYAVVAALLYEYYCSTMRPLDHVICLYNVQSLVDIVFSSVQFSVKPLLFFLCSVGFGVASGFFLFRLKKQFPKISVLMLSVMLCIGAFVDYSSLLVRKSLYKTDAEYKIAVNHLSYMFLKIDEYRQSYRNSDSETDYSQIVSTFQKLYSEFDYTDKKYPLQHSADYPDVLGNFFAKTADGTLPNFVFIIVESMGQQYTGVAHPSVSLMPFVDSLKSVGLYWQNCLSTSERTFGVMPSVFASAPHGKYGFSSDWALIPNHNSLLQDFARNGYETSYYYGGDSNFDGQSDFLYRSNLTHIFNPKIDTIPSHHNKWGLDDGYVYSYALQEKSQKGGTPFVDVYQTLTSHEPFPVPDKKYLTQVQKIHDTITLTNATERRYYEMHQNLYASFLYVDDCIRKLVNEYKKRPDFNNTIFVLVGDHRMSYMHSLENPLQKYHVPLVIYSPLLQTSKKMQALVSQLDIAPTINAFLSKNYPDYTISNDCHWLGHSLDTAENFRSKQKLIFALANRDMSEYIQDTFFISEGRLFQFGEDMWCKPVDNETVFAQYDENRRAVRDFSEYVCYHDVLQKAEVKNFTPLHKYCTTFNEYVTFVREEQDSSGNTVARISSSDEYSGLCYAFVPPLNCKTFRLDVSFDYKNVMPQRKKPFIVFEIRSDKKQVYYKKWEISSKDNPKGFSHFSQRSTHVVYGEQMPDNDTVHVYLWNSDHADMLYDNVEINVSGY